MRTVRLSWQKILVLFFLLGIVYFIVTPILLSSDESGSDEGGHNNVHPHDDEAKAHMRVEKDTEEILKRKKETVYRTDGKLGNFEKTESPRTGPGEMGKAHRLKIEQRAEEERLKSNYTFCVLFFH